MKIQTMWVVIRSTPESTINDILTPCTMRSLRLMFLGGLSHEDIVGVYTDKEEAEDVAEGQMLFREAAP